MAGLTNTYLDTILGCNSDFVRNLQGMVLHRLFDPHRFLFGFDLPLRMSLSMSPMMTMLTRHHWLKKIACISFTPCNCSCFSASKYLLGHGVVLQLWFSEESPWQGAPPSVCPSHDLVRLWSPPPQVTEHDPHADHIVQAPSTKNKDLALCILCIPLDAVAPLRHFLGKH